jgi:hypothetical protein
MPNYDPNYDDRRGEPRDPTSIPPRDNTGLYAALAIAALVLAGFLFFADANEPGNPSTATNTEQTVPNTPPPVRTE